MVVEKFEMVIDMGRECDISVDDVSERIPGTDNPNNLTRRLKLIVVMGYANTGKSTVIRRVFARLCCQFGGFGWKQESYWGSINIGHGRTALLYCGEDGGDWNCVVNNLYDIAKRNYVGDEECYNYAIIGLRRVDYGSQSRVWKQWIENAVDSIRNGAWINGALQPAIPNAFNNLDVYYIHTAWPEQFPVGRSVQDTVTAMPKSLTIPTVDELSRWCEDQVVDLIKRMW